MPINGIIQYFTCLPASFSFSREKLRLPSLGTYQTAENSRCYVHRDAVMAEEFDGQGYNNTKQGNVKRINGYQIVNLIQAYRETEQQGDENKCRADYFPEFLVPGMRFVIRISLCKK